MQKLNQEQAHWVPYLLRFDFTLKHVLDTKIEKANRLSRRLNWKVGTEYNNSNQTLIKKQWIHSLVEVVIKEPEVEIVEKARGKDQEVVRVVKKMKKAEVKELWGDKWQIEEDLVLKEEKMYVPKNEELRVEIIQLHYNILVAGYGGR